MESGKLKICGVASPYIPFIYEEKTIIFNFQFSIINFILPVIPNPVKEVMPMVLFGADRVAEFAHLFTGRVALLTAPSGRTRDNRSTIEVLKEVCDLRLLLVSGP